jgi:uncharacterized membrane protein
MQSRPKINLTLSAADKTMELAGKLLLIIMWALTIFIFFKLPAIIPIHFNAMGKADSYGSKLMLLILPLLATVIYFGLTKLNKYPHIFNYMTAITEDNAVQQYTIATRILRFLKLGILLVFSLIMVFIYLTSEGIVNGLGAWFLPLTLAILLIPTAIGISQSFRKKNN